MSIVYSNGHYSYINEQRLKKLRTDELGLFISITTISVIACLMFQLVGRDAFVILRKLGKFNASMVDHEFEVNQAYTPPSSCTIPG